MTAMKCDICGVFYDLNDSVAKPFPANNSRRELRVLTNRIGLCEVLNADDILSWTTLKQYDICPDCADAISKVMMWRAKKRIQKEDRYWCIKQPVSQ